MTENVMKLLKRVLDTFVLEMVDNELMQFDKLYLDKTLLIMPFSSLNTGEVHFY